MEEQSQQLPILFTTSTLAKYLGIAKATLKQYRLDGGGPEYLKIGHLIRYRLSDIEKWFDTLVSQKN
ncbi:MAG: helix-turn-helix domain-containing protein [Rickettsiales bacterium]|jgi:predicted DNA-binding transcriptional regulator AlpA|nr:helix-turn-helix domain-containing protein [Rickettsiales bacterium]